MNSDNGRDANRIIEKIFELLDEQYLYQSIDKIIEDAAASFEFDKKAPITHQYFIRIIGDFVKHIFENGVRLQQIMSAPQAQTEAIAILETGYQGPHERGYDAAFMDTLNNKLDGYEFLFTQIAEILKDSARQKHIQWVYASLIDPLDWCTRCQVVEIIINRWTPFLPPNIDQSPSAQFVDKLPELIELLRFTDGTVGKILNADFDWTLMERSK